MRGNKNKVNWSLDRNDNSTQGLHRLQLKEAIRGLLPHFSMGSIHPHTVTQSTVRGTYLQTAFAQISGKETLCGGIKGNRVKCCASRECSNCTIGLPE